LTGNCEKGAKLAEGEVRKKRGIQRREGEGAEEGGAYNINSSRKDALRHQRRGK